jgi:flagellar protein FlaF
MQQAAQVYQKTQQATTSPRQLEARLLLKAAHRMEDVSKDETIDRDTMRDALAYNKKIWTLFVTAVTEEDSPLPTNIRENIANLGIFVFKQTRLAEGRMDKTLLRSLISINREIAGGLRG